MNTFGWSSRGWCLAGMMGIVTLVLCAMETSPAAAKYGPPYPQNYPPAGYADPSQGYGPPPGQPQQY